MPKIQLNGRVVHAAGPWGVAKPVKGASVKVFDLDAPSKGNDLLLDTQANNDGQFNGMSADWQDRITVTPAHGPIPAQTAADPTDIPLFSVVVKGSGGQTHTANFPIPPGVSTFNFPPIIVPWQPGSAPAIVADKNGANAVSCWDGAQVTNAISARVAAKKDFAITLTGPEMAQLASMSADQMLNWLAARSPQVAQELQRWKSALEHPPVAGIAFESAAVILAMAVCIIVFYAGVTGLTIATGVAVALVVALILNYDVRLETTNTTNPDGTTTQSIRLVCVKRSELHQ